VLRGRGSIQGKRLTITMVTVVDPITERSQKAMKEVDRSMSCAQDEENIEVILALLSNFFSSRKKEKNSFDIFR